MKNPSFSIKRPTKCYLQSIPKDRNLFRATGFAMCFQISFLRELFPPDFGQHYNPIDLPSAHCLHIFSARSPFLLSVAGQCSDPFARDQLQTSERSQPANRVALGEYTPDSLPPPSPLTYLSVLPDMSRSLLLCSPVRSTCSSYTSARLVTCGSV